MKIKNFIPYLTAFFCTILPAYADIVWPSLYIVKGLYSIKVIVIGLIIELLFVKYLTGVNWKKASVITILMNLITTIIGTILIPISGLCSEFIFDFVFHAYDKFGIGTFHWSHWLISYILIILINTFIESLCIKIALELKMSNILWWMLIANSISVFVCFIYICTTT